MRLSLLCLELSAAHHLSEEVRHRMRGCLAVLRGPPTSLDYLLSPDEAGLILAASLLDGDPGEAITMVRDARLTALDLEGGGERVSLPPDALTGNPFFGPWVATSLAAAVAKALMAGATFTNLAMGAPTIEHVELTPHAGELVARCNMQFRSVTGSLVNASAVYGAAAGRPVEAITRVAGATLMQLGAMARELTQTNSTRPEGANDTPAEDQARDPAVTVH